MTFKKVRWALCFPLPLPSKDPNSNARRFSSTPTFRQGPRSGEALEDAIRVAICRIRTFLNFLTTRVSSAPFVAMSILLLLMSTSFIGYALIYTSMFAQRDEGDKSSIPCGLFAFFCGNISPPQVVELIKHGKATMTKLSTTCAPSSALTRWSYAQALASGS